jgi:hypothetical protein
MILSSRCPAFGAEIELMSRISSILIPPYIHGWVGVILILYQVISIESTSYFIQTKKGKL